MTLVAQLRRLIVRAKEAKFSRDKAEILSELIPLLEKCEKALNVQKTETPKLLINIDPDVAQMLLALGQGSQFPGREFYINRTQDFDAAARRLFARFKIEDIKLLNND